ncbi:MAG: DEAD/DEAH box helicase [Erysipelotrichaceae bacterium]|nr:DEAD/DEAH box helicase [Erysipelotrichaceae bacterium]
MKRYEDFNLKPETMDFIHNNGFKEPTPIQEQVIPAALKGKDIIGLSATGSGKTHAYLIPIMEKTDPDKDYCQAVITAPTRELAAQIFEMARVMNDSKPELRIRLLIGGRERSRDAETLEKAQPHIVIGTPGRIRDLFLNDGSLRIEKAQQLVVDEADMTLEYGFLDDIDAFAGRLSEDLQMMCFSATMPDQLKPFIRKYMHHPITFQIGEKVRFNPDIRHVLVPCYHHSYAKTILSILPGFRPYVCLIFANTRQEAAAIAEELRKEGVSVSEIHGDLTSRKRKQAMKSIASAEHTYVVATDLAARGIDIGEVSHVISCGFPDDLEYYVHRAGRTGRAGSSGTCYALYKESDDAAIRSLKKRGIKFEHQRYRKGEWQDLQPYGVRRARKDDELEKKIAMIMTKKNTKVKPGYKKKRAAAIDRMHRQKKREMIRSKIREEKKAMYKARAKQDKENGL